jgi:hypothetical protein
MGGVVVSMLPWSVVHYGFKPLLSWSFIVLALYKTNLLSWSFIVLAH